MKSFMRRDKTYNDLKVRLGTERIIYVAVLLAFLCVSLFTAFLPQKNVAKKTEVPKEEKRVSVDGNVEKTEYVLEGVLQRFVLKTKNENTVLTEYFDGEGKRKKQSGNYYALLQEKDDEGHNLKTTYLGRKKEPVNTTWGYAVIVRVYDEEGHKVSERYFDQDGEPVISSSGYHAVVNHYEKGKLRAITYLDVDGKATKSSLGYATVKRTYYENGSLETETYYDEKGNPTALSLGQYGTKRVNGKVIYIDRKGREMFALRNHLYGHLISVIIAALLIAGLSLCLGKKGNAILLVLFLFCIAYMTLLYREEGNPRSKLELLWSYRQFFSSASMRVEIINNIWLFLPLGTILFRQSQKRRVVIIAVLISAGIELIQYVTGLGLAELDDVLSNGLGGLLGMWLGYVMMPVLKWGRKSI